MERIVRDGIEFYRQCKCLKERIAKNRLAFAAIPEVYKDCKLKDFRLDVYTKEREVARKVCKGIKLYVDNFEQMKERGLGLYLYSNSKGSGKTRLISSIANELLKNYQVKFATSQRIIEEIKKSWDKNSEYTESKIINDLCNADILIIDDFGVEKISSWVNDKFYYIINERYIKKRITMFTSNESLETIEYDERIMSRIKENTLQFHFPEESIRERIMRQNENELAEMMGEQT